MTPLAAAAALAAALLLVDLASWGSLRLIRLFTAVSR